ncbi:DUF6686 family protein [Pelobium manganitolerans]|uniref:DUF6686 family protein n=1 Tax=Pelobium manganitolerans TaxID=1842495 RepID=UPI003FA347F7
MCNKVTLSKKGAAHISYCAQCKHIYIWHRNLMLTFSDAQFRSFKKYTESPDFNESFYRFPDGENRLILHTPNADICFAFTEDEWTDFYAAMEEAEYMCGVYRLIY